MFIHTWAPSSMFLSWVSYSYIQKTGYWVKQIFYDIPKANKISIKFLDSMLSKMWLLVSICFYESIDFCWYNWNNLLFYVLFVKLIILKLKFNACHKKVFIIFRFRFQDKITRKLLCKLVAINHRLKIKLPSIRTLNILSSTNCNNFPLKK